MSENTKRSKDPTDAVDLALSYKKRGLAPVAVNPNSKRAHRKGWNKKALSEPEIQRSFKPDDNVGIAWGELSHGFIDIDLDSEPALALAPSFLPQTNSKYGRDSAPKSHWLYQLDDIPKTRRYADPVPRDAGAASKTRAMQVELRSTGTMSVAPGSRHPSGETYRWDENGEPGKPTRPDLESGIVMLGVACLLANHYPEDGVRHDFAHALSGTLLRGGMGLDDVKHLVETIARYVGDEEWEDRVRCVEDTARKLESGEPVTGQPTLTDYLDKKVVDRIAKWFGFTAHKSDNAIGELNAKHAVVTIGGRARILVEQIDPHTGALIVQYLTKADFELLYANRFVQVADTKQPLGRVWLHHPERRQYDQVVFEPGGDFSKCYNLWRGFAVEPKKGDWSLLNRHIRDVICGGDEVLHHFVLAFMADAVQNPRSRPGVAIALRGKQGTGKGLLWGEFGALFKPHFVHVTHQHHFTGHFNAHMDSCLLLFVDEAYWAGDKVNLGYVKSLITDPTLIIEKKGKDVFSINNYIRIVMASNENWVVPAALDDRRFCVIDVSDTHANDRGYFGPIYQQMNNGGREAMLYDLLNYDLSGIDLGDIPKTAARLEQQILSADPIVQWWHSLLAAGNFEFKDIAFAELNYPTAKFLDKPSEWLLKAPTAALHSDYLDYCKQQGIRHPESPQSFGTQFRRICPGAKKKRFSVPSLRRNPDCISMTNCNEKRMWGYEIPTIKVCRTAFTKATGLNIDWDL